MRDFHMPGRSAAYAANGMAATSHPVATLTALDVLRGGGNAVDAAVAAMAVHCVVEPGMTGIGGDCFVLLAPASGGVVALNASGRAPAAATVPHLQELGVDEIKAESPHAITVPGAVGGWELLLGRYGTKGLDELLQPAIRAAEDGFAVTPRVAFDWARSQARLEQSEGAKAFYLPAGKPPGEGRLVRLPALARTLKKIAEGGAQAFYTGELAEKMLVSLKAWGGLHTAQDLAGQRAEIIEPIHTNYRDHRVYQCPPNGQGVITLMLLNILEGYELGSMAVTGAERLHLLAEATKLAFRDRDALLADPARATVPLDKLLDKAYAAKLRALVEPDRALVDLPPPLLEPHPDTVYLTVVDKDLNAVSFINSLYDAFGSGRCCAETGVLFHNRGKSFRLDPTHPNCIAPGKRPMHTIIPGLAFKGGEVAMAFGVMGGNYQPVGQAHVLTACIDHGLDPQAALDLPRTMAYPTDMEVERGVGPVTRAGLQAKGHTIIEPESPLGGGQMIQIDRKRGVLIGGSDPRKDGLALGY